MTTSKHALGYQYELIDSVFEDFYCTSCKFVARRLTTTGCCGETYCHDCIAETQEQGKPCPACGEKDFSLTKHIKYRKKIGQLQVYCSMKERGCDWSGPLEQLDTHLDPDQDNCQYVDTNCPLHCHMTILKNKVEQHVAEYCTNRPYVCQYCNFKATYEEVKDIHMPECKYVPLQCPNLCGVTFERDFMEDHMKMCRLEEVGCEFSGVGCDDRFKREDQEEHIRHNSQKHLTLTASLSVETREQLQDQKEKLKEQEQEQAHILQEQKLKLNQKLKEQEQMIKDQALKLEEQSGQLKIQDQMIKDQALKLEEQSGLLKIQDQKLKELEQSQHKLQEMLLKGLSETDAKLNAVMRRTFTMKNFSEKKRNGGRWNSPVMYTHVGGYKYHIAVYPNGAYGGLGKGIATYLYSMPGECDDQLKWPIRINITLELVNQRGGDNVSGKCLASWSKPLNIKCIGNICRIIIGSFGHFLYHSELEDFLVNDKLHFLVS